MIVIIAVKTPVQYSHEAIVLKKAVKTISST